VTNLLLDVGKKAKSKEDFYPRADGETYSFKVVIGNTIFYSMSFFGTKEAQRKSLQKLVDSWPKKIEIELIKEEK